MEFATGELNVICTDVDKSLRFYRDVLGLKEVEREGKAVRLRSKTLFVLLLPEADRATRLQLYPSIPTFSLDLMVEDLQAAYVYLKESKVKIDLPVDFDEGYFVIRDPDGLPLEVIGMGATEEVD